MRKERKYKETEWEREKKGCLLIINIASMTEDKC